MRRRTTASTLLTVALLTCSAAGQPPAPPADTTDALIQKALANDPDVQVARAKLALAEAEVAKARHVAVGRLLALRDAVEHQKAELDLLLGTAARQEALRRQGGIDAETLQLTQAKVVAARATLARAETDLRLLTGDGPKVTQKHHGAGLMSADALAALLAGEAPKGADPSAVARLNALLRPDVRSLAGPIPARLGAALEKRVSLGEKGKRVTFAEALDVFKAKAGFDIPVRPMPQPLPEIVSDGVELPVIAWLQMFQDLGGRQGEGFAFYVREYGLLVANRQTAPPDAVSLTAFWRAHSEAEAAPVARQPEPKQPPAKQHEFPHDKLPAAIKVKAGETIVVTFPVKTADVEEAKVGADSPAVVVQVASRDRMLLVTIRAERAGKARVTWDITDMAGRRFSERGREVEFE